MSDEACERTALDEIAPYNRARAAWMLHSKLPSISACIAADASA
jgi:hypothetical protein